VHEAVAVAVTVRVGVTVVVVMRVGATVVVTVVVVDRGHRSGMLFVPTFR
jgi:hypothetical protein